LTLVNIVDYKDSKTKCHLPLNDFPARWVRLKVVSFDRFLLNGEVWRLSANFASPHPLRALLTSNVPVVYIARDVMILMGGKSETRAHPFRVMDLPPSKPLRPSAV
jgi:hypothetical protein